MPTHSNGDGRATVPNITDIGTQATPPLLLRRVIGAAISAVGILLLLLILFLYVFTPLAAGRDQHRLLSSLTGNPISTFALTKGVVPREGSAVALLRIPSLDLTQAVVAGSSAADLETGPGLVPGTVIPGEQGNSVIAGRRVTFGGPFAAIGTLHRGDLISITDGLGTFKYHVTTLRTALSGQRVVGGTKDNRLTLVTSNSRYSTSGLEVVNAILVGKPVPTLTRLSRVIPADQRGLSGDPGAGWQILIWALVFIGALVLTSLALRRWRRPLPTYLLAVPILIACGLFTVEAVALALPATL
jgi:LPXTG-site transpeptidase (sortase) family protein